LWEDKERTNLEEAHSQPEPARPEDPLEDSAELTLDHIIVNSQEWLAQKLAEMPELDSPQFWQWVEQPATGRVAEPAALAWAMQQFALSEQPDKVLRVFTALYLIFEKRALLLARKTNYVNRAADSRAEMAEEVALLAWQALYNRLTDDTRPLLMLYNFAAYFQKIIATKARDQALANGSISRVNQPAVKRATEATKDQEVQEPHQPKTAIVYNQTAQSLDAPIGKNGQSSAELTLGSLIADANAAAPFEEIETIEIFKELSARLDPEEKEILYLRVEGYNTSQIAKMLNRDWQTIDRRVKSIREKARPLEAVQRVEKETRRKVGRPAKYPARGK
jgi:RNA polymerase sigma factor (sigma-70 family)